MTHPAFNGSFAHLKLGRLPKRNDPRTLKLSDYVVDSELLPTIPSAHDWTTGVSSWPMYGNDRLGDCTIAAAGHMIEAWTEAAGKLVVPPDALVEDAYWKTGSRDDGRVEVDVLNYWRQHGIAGHKIAAYVQIDPRNHAHVKAGIYLFGGVYVGIALPVTAQTQREWKYVDAPGNEPGSWGGHAVPYLGYTRSTVKLVTWGATTKATLSFNDHYTDEVYAVLSPDFFSNGNTPTGFNVAQLQADLQLIGTG